MTVDFKFYGITDRSGWNPDDFLNHLRTCLEAGVRAVQIREKNLSPRELYELCKTVKTLCDRTSSNILVNDRIDIAAALDLDGVHLTESSLTVDAARRVIGPGKLIGVSTHDLQGARRAAASGADFVVCGPVAPTRSKPEEHRLLPLDEFTTICTTVSIPVFALGGIQLDNVAQWISAGAFGVAGISLLMDPHDPAGRLRKLEKIVGDI